jgi:hypothetical protein
LAALALWSFDTPSASARRHVPAVTGLSCSGPFVHTDRPVVLLVHGTGQDVASSWQGGYLSALPEAGFDACAVSLVDNGNGDIQQSAALVAQAIRDLAEAHGRVDIVTHSQGGLEARLALLDPVLRAVVPTVVQLGSPNNGTAAVGVLCARLCQPAIWQMRPGSALLHAINARPLAGATRWLSLSSATDGIVSADEAVLPGAANLVVQSVCSGRTVTHAQLLTDAAVYTIVLAALNDGRVDPAVACSSHGLGPNLGFLAPSPVPDSALLVPVEPPVTLRP